MFSPKTTFAILCLLALPLFTAAEKASGSRLTSKNDDSRSKDNSSETRTREIKDIGGKTLDDWIKDLSHADPSIRAHAITVLPGFGEWGARAVKPLSDRLLDRDNSPRVKAAIALRMMHIPVTQRGIVVKALGSCMVSPNSQAVVRYEVMVTLAMRFCPLQDDERSVLLDLAANIGSNATFELRQMAILTLIAAGPDEKKGPDPRITNALIPRTDPRSEPAEQVRLEAIMALGALTRPHDPNVLKNVLAALRQPWTSGSKNRVIHMWSHVALMALDDGKVYEKELRAIAANLKDKEATVRSQTLTALGALQDKAHAYVGDICTMLRREKDSSVKTAAAQALGHMGNKGERVINALITMTELEKSEDVEVVMAACEALSKLGVNDAATIQAMESARRHTSLKNYQQEMIKQYIGELVHPRKKLKDVPKSPEDRIERKPAGGR